MTTGREVTPIAASADPAAILREFQRRRKEFERRWALTVATMLFPGVLAFGLAAEFLPEGALQVTIIVGAFLLVAAGVVRGFSLRNKDRRCPKCNRIQELGFCTPYRTCASCGCRLSEGWRDSR